MIRFLFDLMSACAHFMWDVFQALMSFGFSLLSAIVTVITWPFQACCGLLSSTFHWAPLFAGFFLLLALLFLGAMTAALFCRSRRYK